MQKKALASVKAAGFSNLCDDDAIYLCQEQEEEINRAADYIIKKYERPLLLKLIKEGYCDASSMQKNYILSNIERYNTDKEVGYEARKKIISGCIRDYLKEGKTKLYFEGFVIFRLLPYENILNELIERLIEDRLCELEYSEFIRLLRYFVNLNDNRPSVTNVLVRADGVYELFDKNGENITKKCLKEFITEDAEIKDVSFDDLLISMLITLAPKRIIVHGKSKIKNRELFKTVEQVFQGNVLYCEGCAKCRH